MCLGHLTKATCSQMTSPCEAPVCSQLPPSSSQRSGPWFFPLSLHVCHGDWAWSPTLGAGREGGCQSPWLMVSPERGGYLTGPGVCIRASLCPGNLLIRCAKTHSMKHGITNTPLTTCLCGAEAPPTTPGPTWAPTHPAPRGLAGLFYAPSPVSPTGKASGCLLTDFPFLS